MAIYRLEAKIISRSNRGRSVVRSAAYRSGSILHSAAYRSGSELRDDKSQATFNYRPRAQEVVHSEILAPKDGPFWLQGAASQNNEELHRQRAMRERLWNTIEQVEKRKDSRLAREFVAALPRELSVEQQVELVRGWCDKEFVSKRLVVDFAIHKSKDGKNPHAHILCTTRPVEGQGFGKKPSTAGQFCSRSAPGRKGKSELTGWRESWEFHANAALEKAGREERIDRRSLKDRGLDLIPQPKIGVAATAMKRRGILPDPERFKLVRYIKSLNFARPWLRSIEKTGEVYQHGMGKNWWERSLLAVSHAARSARETVLDTWRSLLNSRQPGGHEIPPNDRGPDISR
jgi:ATP-dependent exoDNAse (exonuclease V) alpha subunit